MVAQEICNFQVAGSSPVSSTIRTAGDRIKDLLCLQSSLLQTGNAGADPYCHALGRAQNATGASRSLHQACDRDNEGKA